MLTADKVKITPQNIVASCKFGVTLPLERISSDLGAEFNPDQFPGAIYHMPQGHTFLLFKNGKAVLAGCKSEPQLHQAAEDLRKELRKIGVEIKNPEIEIQNLVFSLELGVWIDLERFVETVLDSDYSPELFPGLTYKIHDPSSTFLIFSSGKCVLAGLKNICDLQKAIEKLVETVNNSGSIREHLKTAASMKEESKKEALVKAAAIPPVPAPAAVPQAGKEGKKTKKIAAPVAKKTKAAPVVKPKVSKKKQAVHKKIKAKPKKKKAGKKR